MGYYEQLKAMTDRFAWLRGEALLDQIERVIDLADRHEDEDHVVSMRIDLVRLASDYDLFDRELKAFNDLRAHYGRNPDHPALREAVAWFYKWIMERAPDWAEVSRDIIDRMFAEMESFYDEHGLSLGPAHQLRCLAASQMGLLDEADRCFEAWQDCEVDDADDCPACRIQAKVQYLLDTQRIPQAIEAAQPVLSGEHACETVPTTTVSRLLLPLAFTGRGDDAEAMRPWVYRHVRNVPSLLGHLGDHVLFLALTRRRLETVRPCAILLGRAERTRNTRIQFEAYRAVWCAFALLAAGGVEQVRMARVQPIEPGQGPVNTEAVMKLAGERAAATAAALDARNGTSRFEDRLRSLHEVVSAAVQSDPDDDPL